MLQNATALAPLFAHLLQQTQKLQAVQVLLASLAFPSMLLGESSMLLRVLNATAQEHPALLCSPQVVPAHPDGKAQGCSIVRKVPDIPKLLSSPWATSVPVRPSPSEHSNRGQCHFED